MSGMFIPVFQLDPVAAADDRVRVSGSCSTRCTNCLAVLERCKGAESDEESGTSHSRAF